MKFIKTLTATACAAAFLLSTTGAMAESCCVKAKAAGKDCEHKCCVAARAEKKTCDKCQAEPTCCDKAIAAGKACEHKCCAEATKDKKVCEKCNAKKAEKKA
jgi:hypothetical protein